MIHKTVRLSIFGILALVLTYCANPVAPSGGEKDTAPPELVDEKSTPNFQTKFTKQDIKLTFNEWVELKDAFNQIVISPPLKENDYEVKIKGKSIVFHFKPSAELLENATYTINFGEAIRDITERNPAENLRYVFSTGDYIDSLQVRGKLINSLTGEPVVGALLMLYDNTADSVVRTQRPFYFGKTDTSGRYAIDNIRAGTFKAFALKEEGLQNYLFDNPIEMIGFPDAFVILGDSTSVSIDTSGNQTVRPVIIPNIQLFTEVQPLYITEVDSTYRGQLKLGFNRITEDLDLDFSSRKTPPVIEYDSDTLRLWYKADSINWTLLVQKDSLLNDTIPVRGKGGKTAILNYFPKKSTKGGTFRPKQTIAFAFSQPLVAYDTAFIRVKEDTTETIVQPIISFDTISGRKLQFSYPWKAAKLYAIDILPNAVEDMFGQKNKDTIQIKGVARPLDAYGNIILNIKNGIAGTSYVIQLLNEKNKNVATFKMNGAGEFTFKKEILPTGDYHLNIIVDVNHNGKWDTGNYDAQIQPEAVMERKIKPLLADWDVEVEVDLQ